MEKEIQELAEIIVKNITKTPRQIAQSIIKAGWEKCKPSLAPADVVERIRIVLTHDWCRDKPCGGTYDYESEWCEVCTISQLLPIIQEEKRKEWERINTELEDILNAADGDYYSRIQALRVRLSREAGL